VITVAAGRCLDNANLHEDVPLHATKTHGRIEV